MVVFGGALGLVGAGAASGSAGAAFPLAGLACGVRVLLGGATQARRVEVRAPSHFRMGLE